MPHWRGKWLPGIANLLTSIKPQQRTHNDGNCRVNVSVLPASDNANPSIVSDPTCGALFTQERRHRDRRSIPGRTMAIADGTLTRSVVQHDTSQTVI
jgi:hypothetical protein